MRSVHKTAVGNRSSAGGTVTAIIHTKVLQNATLKSVRGDAVGTLQSLLGTSCFLPTPPKRPGLSKAALNVVVVKGMDPDSPDEDPIRRYEPSYGY
jgi:hypothetical protein